MNDENKVCCKFLKDQDHGFNILYCDNPKKRYKEHSAYDYKIVYPFIHEKEGNGNNDCTMFEQKELVKVSEECGFFKKLFKR